MRLVFQGGIVKLTDVPAGLELSKIPATTWDPVRRILRARADRAPAIRAELAQRGVRFTDSERRLADVSGTILEPLVAVRDATPDAAFACHLPVHAATLRAQFVRTRS